MTTTTTTFVGAKGGVGTTTVAALHALDLAARTGTVRLSAADSSAVDDLAGILGGPVPAPGEVIDVCPGLTLADHPAPEAHNVVDGGTDSFSDHEGAVYLVVRNDYLSLRRAMNAPRTTVGVILISEAERSLDRRDIAHLLGYPIVAEVAVEPATARVIDAGLLATVRRPQLAILLRR
ncbi:MAG TPA: hypothetical protein VF711_04200 [Acidimicrobiales bacterium]|jgi:hypothetical protein